MSGYAPSAPARPPRHRGPGGRRFGLFLIGTGAFVIMLAPLLAWWVYPTAANFHTKINSVNDVEADNATMFNPNGFQLVQGAKVTAVQTMTADPKASASCPGNNITLHSDIAISINGKDAGPLMSTHEVVTQNRNTAEAVHACAHMMSNQVTQYNPKFDPKLGGSAMNQTGIELKMPFNTQKKDYPWFDMWTGSDKFPMVFVDVLSLKNGLLAYDVPNRDRVNNPTMAVYRFVQTIPDTVVMTVPVPRSVVDKTDTSGEAGCDTHYTNTVTLLIEPNTGTPVYEEQNLQLHCVFQSGYAFDLAKMDQKLTIDTINRNSKLANLGPWLGRLAYELPVVLLALGILMFTIAAVFLRQVSQAATASRRRTNSGNHQTGSW